LLSERRAVGQPDQGKAKQGKQGLAAQMAGIVFD
jgi:hypothetical protein